MNLRGIVISLTGALILVMLHGIIGGQDPELFFFLPCYDVVNRCKILNFLSFKCKWSPNVCCSAALVISLFSLKNIVHTLYRLATLFFLYCAVLLLDFNKEKEILCHYKQRTDYVNFIVIQSCAFKCTY